MNYYKTFLDKLGNGKNNSQNLKIILWQALKRVKLPLLLEKFFGDESLTLSINAKGRFGYWFWQEKGNFLPIFSYMNTFL